MLGGRGWCCGGEGLSDRAIIIQVTLKVLFTRPEMHSQQKLEEASVYLSVLPIRLNMDQDTVLFLYEFARHISGCTQCEYVHASVCPLPLSSLITALQCPLQSRSQ